MNKQNLKRFILEKPAGIEINCLTHGISLPTKVVISPCSLKYLSELFSFSLDKNMQFPYLETSKSTAFLPRVNAIKKLIKAPAKLPSVPAKKTVSVDILPCAIKAPAGTIINSLGNGKKEDLDLLLSVGEKIMGNTICALGDAAATPVESFIKHFREEFEYYIEHGKSMVETKPNLIEEEASV